MPRNPLEVPFTVVTAHPTVKSKFMVVTSERPCMGCAAKTSLCCYILSPLGEHIFKASKCTHCATTNIKCGQAGALYRFDKDMREGRLIDPRVLAAVEESSDAFDSASSTSPVSPTSSEHEHEVDSGNEGGSEGVSGSTHNTSSSTANMSSMSADLSLSPQSKSANATTPTSTPPAPALVPSATGLTLQTAPNRANRGSGSASAAAAASGSASASGSGSGSGSLSDSGSSQERLRRSTKSTPGHPAVLHRRAKSSPPTPLILNRLDRGDRDRERDLPLESPGKSVRFALPPPSPPLSNTSRSNASNASPPSNEESKNKSKERAAPQSPSPVPQSLPQPQPQTQGHSQSQGQSTLQPKTSHASTSTHSSSSRHTREPAPPTPPPEDPKMHTILTKLSDLELRLGSVEGVNTTLRAENRRLQKKNNHLKRVVASLRASNRASSDALVRALRVVEDMEFERRRLIDEIR